MFVCQALIRWSTYSLLDFSPSYVLARRQRIFETALFLAKMLLFLKVLFQCEAIRSNQHFPFRRVVAIQSRIDNARICIPVEPVLYGMGVWSLLALSARKIV